MPASRAQSSVFSGSGRTVRQESSCVVKTTVLLAFLDTTERGVDEDRRLDTKIRDVVCATCTARRRSDHDPLCTWHGPTEPALSIPTMSREWTMSEIAGRLG